MNTWSGLGRLTKDPDINVSQSGMKVAKYTLAVDRNGKDTDFIPCKAFDKKADFAEKYLHKGIKIGVTGSIQTGSFERDGRRIYTWDVIVKEHDFCESRREPTEEAPDDFMSIPEGIDEEAPFV